MSEDQEHRQSVFQNTSEFYVQKQHKSGDKLCLSVCQVLKIVTDRNTHILTLQQAHINTTSDNQSTKQISWLQWAKKTKTFKCSEGESSVPLEFGALVCEIWSDHFVSDTKEEVEESLLHNINY